MEGNTVDIRMRQFVTTDIKFYDRLLERGGESMVRLLELFECNDVTD